MALNHIATTGALALMFAAVHTIAGGAATRPGRALCCTRDAADAMRNRGAIPAPRSAFGPNCPEADPVESAIRVARCPTCRQNDAAQG